MSANKLPSRREMLMTSVAGIAGAMLTRKTANALPLINWQAQTTDYVLDKKHLTPLKLKGRLKQSACRWCYNKVAFDDLAQAAKAMGLVGLDLVDKKDWPTLKKYGLQATMVYGAGNIPDALNRLENHDKLEKEFTESAALAAEYGWKNVITFSGNRKGLPDNEGLANCVIGLNRLKPIAEKYNVVIHLELLNSLVNHKDYQFDHMAWGVEVMKLVNSPNMKILYDIYHAQIMDGNIMQTIKQNLKWIGHFHTGGVPGRHELDETQELQWRSVMKAIADLGYQGYVAHEFVPTKPDPLESLREAILLSDV